MQGVIIPDHHPLCPSRGQVRPGRTARNLRRRAGGFSLVEIMVTVTIISMLAAMSVPAVQSVKRRTIATAVANDLRTFAGSFDVYSHETGGWPPEADAGVFPPEMAGRINETAWKRPTPFGGQYNWENNQMHNGTRIRAAIAISSTASSAVIQDVDLLEAIDRLVDDGNLTTGNFRLGADDEPVYLIAP
jgi:prepilin-type N-terminal cleavage/methylation domain-containing protein